MSWSLLPEYKLIQICYVQGLAPVCPVQDLVHHLQIPTEKPKAGVRFPWLLLVADAKQFSRAKENLKVSGEAPCILAYCSARGSWALRLGFPESSPRRMHASLRASCKPTRRAGIKQRLSLVKASSGPLLIRMVLFLYQLKAC